VQHNNLRFSVLEIYAKLDTLSCWLVKIKHWLWCCMENSCHVLLYFNKC